MFEAVTTFCFIVSLLRLYDVKFTSFYVANYLNVLELSNVFILLAFQSIILL